MPTVNPPNGSASWRTAAACPNAGTTAAAALACRNRRRVMLRIKGTPGREWTVSVALNYSEPQRRASFFRCFYNDAIWQSARRAHITNRMMRHVLSALLQNQPGVLAQVSGMLASRNFNIDSLAVGETEDARLSRMTFVVHGDDNTLDQVRKQLDKIVSVVRVHDISSENFVERDLMLINVRATPAQRVEISLLVEMFRARVVDVSAGDMMIEISGQESKIEAYIELMRPYGILELARTGRIALVRGARRHGDVL